MAKCGYCRGEVPSPCRCDPETQEELESQRAKAGADLVSAETSYLVSFGWIPHYGPRDDKLVSMRWLRPNSPLPYTHIQALRLQKYLDPFFKEK